ncbi:unnamed protein product [Victoria cruziana]
MAEMEKAGRFSTSDVQDDDDGVAERGKEEREEEEERGREEGGGGEWLGWTRLKFDDPPVRSHHFYRQFRADFSSSIPSSNRNNFLKGIKWSPDGSCFIAGLDDNSLRLFDCPVVDNGSQAVHGYASGEDSYHSRLVIQEGESVYDHCWYPFMQSSDPATCVFATTTRDHPVHLWDSISGQLRCTYRAYDNMDEITAAYSVAFNPSGTKLFAGYNKAIRAFDLHRPGRDFEHYPTLSGNKDGLPGIISCISFSPYNGMLAAGSYSQTTALYAEDTMELLYLLHGQLGGVTQVLFSKDGNYLYTGGRKDPYILCWDVRNTVSILYKLYRSSESTNQRIAFDIEPCGAHLGTGGQDGHVHIYDLQTGQWTASFQAASDTVNGFCFHPSLPMAATSSGHRRFFIPETDEERFVLSGKWFLRNFALYCGFYYLSVNCVLQISSFGHFYIC